LSLHYKVITFTVAIVNNGCNSSASRGGVDVNPL
jgi:hypothetical protein